MKQRYNFTRLHSVTSHQTAVNPQPYLFTTNRRPTFRPHSSSRISYCVRDRDKCTRGWDGIGWRYGVLLNAIKWAVHPPGKSLDCCRPKRLCGDNYFLHRSVKLKAINYFQKRHQLINLRDDCQQKIAKFQRYLGNDEL